MTPKTTTIDGEQVTYTGELTNIKIIRPKLGFAAGHALTAKLVAKIMKGEA